MRFAIGLPNLGAYGDPSLLVELGVMAEQAGWDGVFVWDHVAYREPGWPMPTLTWPWPRSRRARNAFASVRR